MLYHAARLQHVYVAEQSLSVCPCATILHVHRTTCKVDWSHKIILVLQRALAFMRVKDWQNAFDLYTQAVEHISDAAYKLCLFNNRGWAAHNLKYYACAIFDASVASELHTNQHCPLVLRSRSYEAIGLKSNALKVSCFTSACMYLLRIAFAFHLTHAERGI